MAVNQKKINVEVAAETRKFSKGMSLATQDLKKFDSQLKRTNSLTNRMGKTIGKTLVAGLAGLGTAFAGASVAMVAFSKDAIQDRKTAQNLARTLKTIPGITDKMVESNADWIASFELLTGIVDDDLRRVMSRFALILGDVEEAQKATALVMDTVVGSGKSQERVVKALEQAYAGNTKSLQRMFPELDKNKDGVLTLTEALEGLEEAYGGAAEAAADTDPWLRLNTIWGNVKEAIGQGILPLLDKFTEWFKKPENVEKVRQWVEDLGTSFYNLGERAVTYLQNVDWDALKDKLVNGWEKMKDVVGFVKDLWNQFRNLPEGVQTAIALFTAWQALKNVPVLSVLIDWNEAVLKRLFTGNLGKWGTTRITATTVYVSGALAGGASPRPRAGETGGELLDRAYVDAKDRLLRVQIQENNALLRIHTATLEKQSLGLRAEVAARQAADTSTRAMVSEEIAARAARYLLLEQDIKNNQATLKVVQAEMKALGLEIDTVRASLAADVIDLTDTVNNRTKGKNLWGRIVSHIPIIGDIVALGVDIVTLTLLYGKHGYVTPAYVVGEANKAAVRETNKERTERAVQDKRWYGYSVKEASRLAGKAEGKAEAQARIWVDMEADARRRGDWRAMELMYQALRELRSITRLPGTNKPVPDLFSARGATVQTWQYAPGIPIVTGKRKETEQYNKTYNTTVVNNYPEPERSSTSLAMSLRVAQFAQGGN